MTIISGTRLGPYEILSPLGAGGMGEVYTARDIRLGRDVAVKVLPEALARDPHALARFEREAKAVAALSHPNILSIFDFGREGEISYVVTELLEGETLRVRLRGGGLPVRKAIEIASQVARGLAAAHEKGIVHRDLKPENLFVTGDGRAKILDFGLARQTTLPLADDTKSPTAEALTGPGTVLGTVGYMSPEQVRGRPADARSDIFSFGCVLYEMLSRERAFEGSSAIETMNAILTEEPRNLSEAVTRIPPELARVVRHCLEKSPGERFQSIGDVAFNLETAVSGSASRFVSGPQGSRRPLTRIALAVVVAVILFGAGLLLGPRLRNAPAPTFKQLTFRRGSLSAARFAPDGATVIYSAAWGGDPSRLFSVRLGSPESSRLELPDGSLLAISRSNELAIALGQPAMWGIPRGALARVPLAGGAPREVLENAGRADWGPDGNDLAVVRAASGKVRLEYPIGTPLHETTGWIREPRVSPRGDLVAFFHGTLDTDQGVVAAVGPGSAYRVLSRNSGALHGLAWSPSGNEIWFSATSEGQGASLQAVTPSGSERTVLRLPGAFELLDVAPDGRALLKLTSSGMGIAALAPGASRERDLSWLDWSLMKDISPDGRTILFDESGVGNGYTTRAFLRPTDGSPAVRLGDGAAEALSPDGAWVLATTNGERPQLVLLPTRAGQPRQITDDAVSHLDAQFFPDGRRVLFLGREPGKASRLFEQALEGGAPRPLTPEGVSWSCRPLAPDGRRLIATLPTAGRVILDLATGKTNPALGLEPAESVYGWSGDGRAVYAMRKSGPFPARVFRVDVETGKRELIRELLPADAAGLTQIMRLYASADGRSYAYSYFRELDQLFVAEGLK